ncbi:MAG: thioredoxin family protein [Mycobacteriaceae bacterium]|nr:thioredoxin family protein [Mycobacteriaceae bacterium]
MVAVHSTMLALGTHVPTFQLPDAAGKLHSPADAANAGALLVAFVCNHCPYVVHIGPKLGEKARQWATQGLAVLAINANDIDAYPQDGPEHMSTFAEQNGWHFPYLLDETQHVAQMFQAACTPDLFLFDAAHKLAYRGQFDTSRPGNNQPVTGADLDRAVQAVLANKPVAGEQIPSIGCNIKWRPGNQPGYGPV